MANFHLGVQIISRKNSQSVIRHVSYITGHKLNDSRNGKTYYNKRQDVLYHKIFLPKCAPPKFYDLQSLCDAIESAEKRYDARTARVFIGSLPNELPTLSLIQIVKDFIETNFVNQGLCAIAAIHAGTNQNEPSRSNPHVHIIVPTRTVESDGFNPKKDREHDKREYINIWRKRWADVQNSAYERYQLDVRVSHESLQVQGIDDREPTIHLSYIDWKKERLGEHTVAGDQKRAIQERNEQRSQQRQRKKGRELKIELY